MDISTLTKEEILSEELLTEVFANEDEIARAKEICDLELAAKRLKVNTQFNRMCKTFEKVLKDTAKEEKRRSYVDGITDFDIPFGSDIQNLNCGAWQATDSKVIAPISNPPYEIMACPHPITIIDTLKNMETGEEQVRLGFKRRHCWNEVTVRKEVIASASKIVSLSSLGVLVTSETAKPLVKYLADIEALNEADIKVKQSTTKLGWRNGDFVPFDGDILFDGLNRFRNLFESIHQKGERDTWFEHVKEIRRTGRFETNFLLAASFSSVLIPIIGALPYFVDLWGETEGGKSVSLMLAASVWANPAESQYIGDFKTTDVALEAKADMLNNLPMLLDDTSKTSARVRDNFEGIVYDLCSGKGKSRSNKELGINRENSWACCFICNGERPLSGYVNQGGAINRILEVEAGQRIFDNPQRTAELLKANYGFAGVEFVNAIRELGLDQVKKIYRDIYKELASDSKMQKQTMSLAIVLTADRIATEMLFHDDCYISMDDAKKCLVDHDTLSENERCYNYIVDKVAQNSNRFGDQTGSYETWGMLEEGKVLFYPTALDDLCKQGGFSKKAFLNWADRKCLLETDGTRMTKLKRVGDSPRRMIWIKLPEESTEFVEVEDEESLPFD